MQAKPMFLGACALASLAGAISGATTNTRPIQEAGIGLDILPERPIAFDSGDSGIPDVAPPNHYPMMTPQGRVEVAELSMRGLYAQRRYGWSSASYDPLPEDPYAEEVSEYRWEEPSAKPPPELDATPAPPPPALLEVPAPAPAGTGNPRVIDVASALASSAG